METEYYWSEALKRTSIAIKNGALVPLSTELSIISSKLGEGFELRKLIRKAPTSVNALGPRPNPFSPWDPRLEVSLIGNEHVLILNKYPVQQGHMLLITREWAPQHGWLSYRDFQALVTVNNDTKGFWFFNSGPAAGASQPHRHLQLLRRKKDELFCPSQRWLESLLEQSTDKFTKLANTCAAKTLSAKNNAEILLQKYLEIADIIGLGNPIDNTYPRQAYNLLISNDLIVIIRRKQEGIAGFSVNALGFAGYLLSTEISDLDWLYNHGPEALLEAVVERVQ